MSHDNHGNLLGDAVNGLSNLVLSLIVQCAGCLIHNQQARVTVHRTRNTHTLTLTTGKTVTVFANRSVNAFFQSPDNGHQLRQLKAVEHTVIVNVFVGDTEGNCLTQGAITQVGILRDITNLLVPGRQISMDILTLARNRTARRDQQTKNQVNQSSLTRAGTTHESNRGTSRNIQLNVLENILITIRVTVDQVIDLNIHEFNTRVDNGCRVNFTLGFNHLQTLLFGAH